MNYILTEEEYQSFVRDSVKYQTALEGFIEELKKDESIMLKGFDGLYLCNYKIINPTDREKELTNNVIELMKEKKSLKKMSIFEFIKWRNKWK